MQKIKKLKKNYKIWVSRFGHMDLIFQLLRECVLDHPKV